MIAGVENYWAAYSSGIAAALKEVIAFGLPDEEDSFWIILHPQDLRGLPLTINPATSDLEMDDGWEHQDILAHCIPTSIELPDEFTGSPDSVDSFRDSVARFMANIWQANHIESKWPFLFSLEEDGWFFDLKTGIKLSAWDIRKHLD